MPDPKGNLVTPIAFTAAGKIVALLSDDAGHLQLDIITSGLPLGAATAIKQLADDHNVKVTTLPATAATTTIQGTQQLSLTELEKLITALSTVATDQIRVDLVSYPADLDIRDLVHTQDSVLGYGKDSGGTARILRTDAAGRLETVNSMHTTAKVRAFLANPQLDIAHNTYTKVLLDGETYDPSAAFAANKFTAKVAGYYMVAGVVTWKHLTLIADQRFVALFYKNGAAASRATFHSACTEELGVPLSDIIHCDVDDELELYCYHAAGVGTVDLNHGTLVTFMAIHLLSAD